MFRRVRSRTRTGFCRRPQVADSTLEFGAGVFSSGDASLDIRPFHCRSLPPRRPSTRRYMRLSALLMLPVNMGNDS